MEEDRTHRWDEFEKKQLEQLKDHKLFSLFEILKKGKEKLQELQQEQLNEFLSEKNSSEVNYSFLLEILSPIEAIVYDLMVTTWTVDEEMEILPEIFFFESQDSQSPSVKDILKNLARIFREEGITKTATMITFRPTKIDDVLESYRDKRMNEAVTEQRGTIQPGKSLAFEQKKKLFLVEEKYNVLSEVTENLHKKKLIPQSVEDISLSDLFLILADLIEEQTEFLTEV